jgi:hypothetical protein
MTTGPSILGVIALLSILGSAHSAASIDAIVAEAL